MTPSRPKLIHLNGSAGIGKDTIAQKYIDSHPLALCIKTDELITALGQWSAKENYDPARHIAFNLAIEMITAHITAGHDVIIPHLLTDLPEVEALEATAQRLGVPFIEILLHTDKSDALDRVFARGTRGEPGAPPLTSDDRDEFEELYDNVMIAAKTRSHLHIVASAKGNIDETYKHVLDIVGAS